MKRAFISVSDQRTARRLTLWLSVMGYWAVGAPNGDGANDGYIGGNSENRRRINGNKDSHADGAFGGGMLDSSKYDITVTERDGGIDICGRLLTLPLSYRQVEDALEHGTQATTLRLDGRYAILGGERIRLTELEAALLNRMLKARGEFVDKRLLLCEVFGADVEPGILNVYIHYLREKLEKGGEKIIVSSRSRGYRIDGRYIEC